MIVAAGEGRRMGEGPAKQYRLLGGRPVLLWSVTAALACPSIDQIVVVVPAQDEDFVRTLLPDDHRIRLAHGGATRTDSVRSGLAALSDLRPGVVLIHDAARPGLTPEVICELLDALAEADAAAPALTMTDAVKELGEDGRLRAVPRDALRRIQTPQAFRADTLLRAIDQAEGAAVDDLALIEASLGSDRARIALTRGRAELMKITHAEDLAIAERLLASPSFRIGEGFDVHAFGDGEFVTLCGVEIPHSRGLEGHSDADAGWHALTDAILGAAALGDIGDHFPPSDPTWKGASSLIFLAHAVKLVRAMGLTVVNADITLMCERPKIAPHREAMRSATAAALGVSVSMVSVKATTTEKLGFLGREEGIAASASVLLGPAQT
ncbi:MAG: bifunctional 2-C-methyl-D-erythritol 4-phosphate cytidylyltransferase/2-C-methyl-D-erythritol 2,4-cyclodiphosphate synthase [Alphaproteobacteria bacterium]|nr:bifunctional 2-C-methyl-D-erythritol 4-phosphate cytidylyltransferase/2-C-methyl-D-erythritol 2,4-cyclodiphosphate synthase [Alphaproteobacteria bacterium]